MAKCKYTESECSHPELPSKDGRVVKDEIDCNTSVADCQQFNHCGTHVTHCCKFHGCKYCDDDCHVVNGLVEQEANCEDCGYVKNGSSSLGETLNGYFNYGEKISKKEYKKLDARRTRQWKRGGR